MVGMCSTAYLKPLYLVALIIALVFTTAALFSPAWRRIDDNNSVGLITSDCYFQACWWYTDNRASFDHTCLGLMIVAFVLEIFLILASLGMWTRFFVPGAYVCLTAVSFAAMVAIVVTLAIYGAKSENTFRGIIPITVAPPSVTGFQSTHNNQFGYSYWLALIGAIFMAIATTPSPPPPRFSVFR
uniref:MARVEL domain-containing protein n=1 Tax=Bursaphelenchus xylophilus TaxID=6326 RepID=A0A1I7S8K6_BURXY